MESHKEDDPTVTSPRVEKLQLQFMDLQQDWKSYKQSNPKTKRRSCSTNSSSVTIDQLLHDSPRHLMSSLQQRMSPSEGSNWNVRTNDLAVEEIKRDRRAAIKSGKLKGRRLFEAEHEETDIGFDGEEGEWCGWAGLAQESEVSVSFSGSDGDEYESGKSKEIYTGCVQGTISIMSSSSTSSLSGENYTEEDEKELVSVEEEKVFNYRRGIWGRCITVIMRVLAVAALVFAICSISGFDGYENENYEVILVPT